ncbi:uncharacterized protein [Leptinotarsa decemlineata]|uniref:uncharacterized protein n=1 Tax=Leptinotarsa decemlineata TaxID=7539 RepID=UPI003D30446E
MPMKNSNEDPDYILIEHQRETEDEEDENKENESEDYENEENGNSENEHEENENTYENKVDNENLRKKRKKVADPEAWKKNVNKRKRMLGQKYTGYSRTKDGIVKHDKTRCARETGPRCTSKFCEKATNRYCNLFSEDIRKNIFNAFWAMNWEQKKLYVLHMTCYHAPKRTYTKNPSRRTGSFDYFLRTSEEKHQVCKKLFLSTLGIKEKMVRHWVNDGNTFGMMKRQESKNEDMVQRRSHSAVFTEQEKRRKHLENFFTDIPKMESHFCRHRSSKLYLKQDFKTKTEVYHVYKTSCLEKQVLPLSICSFLKVFDELNIGIFKPRKDQCDLCCAFKMKHLDEITYNAHIIAKDQAREDKSLDKKRSEEKFIHCFTMDVQAVKLCPQIQASSLYYKTKLQVHNFTIYNLETHECKNFVWNETEGELCSSVFATCIFKHLQAVVEKEKRPIVIYSDSCGYQNKNHILANALSLFASKYNIVIEQKYLEKGHTQMECDASHSLIERHLKGRDIFLPTDYISVIRNARQKPMPLDVKLSES